MPQYELCYGNGFYFEAGGGNIKSTGFTIAGNSSTVYLTDTPNKDLNGNLDGSGFGVISFIAENVNSDGKLQYTTVVADAGFVDYTKGEIQLFTTNITSTVKPNNVIEIQAYPISNDVIGLKDLYVSLDVSRSEINMVKGYDC